MLKKVVAPLRETLGVKDAEPEAEEDESAREAAPRSAGRAAGAPGGAGPRKYAGFPDLRGSIDEAKRLKAAGKPYDKSLVPAGIF
jgi:predicted flap endonuclease-1-like 5' DNA nuclease